MGKRLLSVLVAALVVAGASIYLTRGGPGDPADLAAGDTSASDPSSEAIKVHGHWKLDIFNADGALDRSVEFENALVGGGPTQLANVLGRVWTPGAWSIQLLSAETQPCDDGSGPEACLISELEFEGPNAFTTLTLDTSTPGELTLAGQATIANTTTIDGVQTQWLNCESNISPDNCPGSLSVPESGSTFTSKLLADTEAGPVPVTEGQVVQVSVTLSFS